MRASPLLALDRRIAEVGGAGAVIAALSAPEPPPRPRFELLGAAELHALPSEQWLVHKVVPERGIAAIYGPSGSGKGFVMVNLAAAIGEGSDFFGYRTKQGRVVYLWLEGKAGASKRTQAWEIENGRPFPNGVRFVLNRFNLASREDVPALAEAVNADGGASAVFIDTYNRATSGGDENNSLDTSRNIEAAELLQEQTGAVVVFAHHTGKDRTRGMRGHSSLHAAMDAVLEVVRTGERRELKVGKAKDEEDGAAHAFQLKVVRVGTDALGYPVTSCVVESIDVAAGPATLHVHRPKGVNQRIVHDALRSLLSASCAFGRAGVPPSQPCITLEDAITGTKDGLTVEPKRRGERAREAINGLISAGFVGQNGDWLWLLK